MPIRQQSHMNAGDQNGLADYLSGNGCLYLSQWVYLKWELMLIELWGHQFKSGCPTNVAIAGERCSYFFTHQLGKCGHYPITVWLLSLLWARRRE